MKDAQFTDRSAQVPCLTTDEFYSYISGGSEGASRSAIESHLVDCPICREELAALLKSLSPEYAGAFPEQEPPASETIATSIPALTLSRFLSLMASFNEASSFSIFSLSPEEILSP